LPVLILLLAAASARADPAKTYRWIGQDGRVYTTTTPPPKGATLVEEKTAAPAKPKAKSSAADTPSCGQYQELVDHWRSARRSLAAAEDRLDQLRSDTDDYVRRNDSYYETQIESAEARVRSAEDRVSELESDAARAGVPQNCFTE
jgi:hypothetical protein